MKKSIALISLTASLLLGVSGIALASGGAATSTGQVKERGNEDNHMGKDVQPQDQDKQDEATAAGEDPAMQPVEEDDKQGTNEPKDND